MLDNPLKAKYFVTYFTREPAELGSAFFQSDTPLKKSCAFIALAISLLISKPLQSLLAKGS